MPKNIKLTIKKNRQFFVRIIASNGEEWFRTSEVYKSKRAAVRAREGLIGAILRGEYEFADETKK